MNVGKIVAMNQHPFEQLSREELITMNLAQAAQIAVLQKELEVLRLKLEKLQKPPTNSKNSAQAPSRDQKPGKMVNRPKQKHGPAQGHAKHERKFVANPTHIVDLKAKTCRHCQAELAGEDARLVDVNQITELPPAQAEVIEVRQYELACPQCGQLEVLAAPEELAMGRTFGKRLEATVTYYRQEQHMSYDRTKAAMLALHGVAISEGGIDKIMQRSGEKGLQQGDDIQHTIQHSQVVASDETGARVDGQKAWHWVFCTLTAVLHVIKPSRGTKVIQAVMGEHQAQIWVSDCLPAQLKASAWFWQLCLAHQLRNLQAVIEQAPTPFWARAMQALFRYAIHLRHQRPQLTSAHYQTEILRIERLCDRLLARPLAHPEARKLQNRYRRHREHLFVFLYRSDVPPTNNVSEQALRTAVVHRKVSGGFRSQWGADAYAALASVIDTAALRGLNAFEAIQALVGKPSLPLPAIP
jgi:transposase